MLPRELLRLAHHAAAALGPWSKDDPGTQDPHDLAPLDREGLGHDRDEGVALGRAHHGEGDTRVARGGFDHRLAGLQRPAVLGIFDDADRQAVLDRRERVEELALHVHRDVLRRESLDSYDGGLADRAEDTVVDHEAPSTLGE